MIVCFNKIKNKYLSHNLIIRQLGLQPYEKILLAMQNFTKNRTIDNIDEIWLLEHPQVFTQGQTGKSKHILVSKNIPIIQSDRGGQITFHGPGQQIIYILINLIRRNLSIKNFIYLLEKIIIDTLFHFNINARTDINLPGIYINNNKICSIGLRIRRGCSFHGLALNVNMDLTPFSYINPCGCIGLQMTQVKNFVPEITLDKVQSILITKLFDYM